MRVDFAKGGGFMTEEVTGGFIEAITGLADELPESVTDVSAVGAFLAKVWDVVQQYIASAGVRLILALLLLIVGFKLANLLTRRIQRSKRLASASPTAQSFLRSFLSGALKVIVVITAIAILGVPMTTVAAVIASAGLAIGMAVEGSLANIASGFILVVSKPFAVGDYISAGDREGTVSDMGIFYTTLAAYDGTTVVLPNSVVTGGTLVNYSRRGMRRVSLEFPAAYGSDVEKVKSVLVAAAAADEKVLAEPAPMAALEKHGDSSLDFILRAWCKADDYWDVYYGLTESGHAALGENGVEIPFPQLDVHMR
ncbi:MAG: mechanosensitive ion channel family protein [Clostridia bacterium]|nr:mechanosensitive ion channel family protein [Clostridia bacterium]